MSVALLVILNRPLDLRVIEEASSQALREILNLDHEAAVEVWFDEPVGSKRATNNLLPEGLLVAICSISPYEEKVRMMPFLVPSSTSGNNQADQTYLSIECHSSRTPLGLALAAAVARAVARLENSQIEDNSGYFTTQDVQSSDEFCSQLKLSREYADIEQAAGDFDNRLPKSAEVTESLRTLERKKNSI
jgi:hypothetical protein